MMPIDTPKISHTVGAMPMRCMMWRAMRLDSCAAPRMCWSVLTTSASLVIGTSQRGGSLEVRLIDQLPFGYLALDSDTTHGQIQVELFLIGLGSKDHNPIFTLHNENDTDTTWYNTYHNQFEVLWRGAKVPSIH
jgi:hypothetical protein